MGLDRQGGAKSGYIEPVSKWDNGHCESFSARFREVLLDGEFYDSLLAAQILLEQTDVG